MDVSRSLLQLAIALAVVLSAVIWALVKAARNPLKAFPGPWYARYSNIRLKAAVISGRRIHYVHALHRKYGPFVRIAPNEIAVNDPSTSKQIHSIGSGFCKDAWYQSTVMMGRPGVFAMTDPRVHAARRKLLARPFSKSFLREHWEHVVQERVAYAVSAISDELRSQGVADVLKWWTLLASDVSSQLMFGESFQVLERGETNEYIRTLQNTLKGSGIGAELPLVATVLQRLPIQATKELFNNNNYLLEYGKAAVRNMRTNSGARNIFANILAEAEKGERLDDLDVQVEATNLIVAGTDTTAITLTYLVWAVMSHPAVQQQLQAELMSLPDDYRDADLERLPYLQAVVEETLRLYGAAPGALPRAVPPGGATVNNFFIPEGTTVTTQSYSLHRDPDMFSSPEEFMPSRWMDAAKPDVELGATKAAFMPFGSGSRTCLGIHLAYMELRLGAAEFFRRLSGDVGLAPSASKECMELENFFLVAPAGHKCEIQLKQFRP